MASGLRHLYLLSVLEGLTAYAAQRGELHFASANEGSKLALTFTIEDGEAYNERVSALFNERFASLDAAAPGTDGASPPEA